MTADGLTTVASARNPKETMDRLERAVKAKGLTVFARIDHAAGAAAAGLGLRPTELLIFGNAKGGTPLMEASQNTHACRHRDGSNRALKELPPVPLRPAAH